MAPVFTVPDFVLGEHRATVAAVFADRAIAMQCIVLGGRRISLDGTTALLTGFLARHLDIYVASLRLELPDPHARTYSAACVRLSTRRRNLVDQAEKDVAQWVRDVFGWIEAGRDAGAIT